MAEPPMLKQLDNPDGRRYRIVGVLGKGGFGKVYRAVMEGAGGFTKDVAIKLLRDEDVPELTIQRFRDEARILGLIRDRAIVQVDPPTRLAGRWAVVMEYVDGASLQRLSKLGPMPAGVVAEVIQETARGLDKVYRMPGPDGEPLRLLHRDIKPANIQLTQDGETKILDFGIAKAEFENREAHTQAYIGGTRGFIAPERLDGKEGPEGDVFSLGVTAHTMLTGDRPSRRMLMGLEQPNTDGLEQDAKEMIELSTRMRSVSPAERPTAREVEEMCSEIRRRSNGITLRRWAEANVPRAAQLAADEMVGTVLSETLAAVASNERIRGLAEAELADSSMERANPTTPPEEDERPSRAPLIIGVLAAVVALIGIGVGISVGVGGVAGGLGMWWMKGEPVAVQAPPPLGDVVAPASRPAPAPIAPARVPEPEPVPVVEPVPVTTPAPEPVAASPKPGKPSVKPSPAPAPAPAPAPDPAASGRTVGVTFASMPIGSDVFVDGRLVGQTPVKDVALTEGSHTVKIVGSSESITRTIKVSRRDPVKYVWKGGESWTGMQ